MPSTRKLNRRPFRPLCRYATRMLGNAHRPSPPDELAVICSALNEVIKIHNRLRPFMEDQRRQHELEEHMREWEPALRRVYGPPSPEALAHRQSIFSLPAPDPDEVLEQELALAKTRVVLDRLKAKLQRR